MAETCLIEMELRGQRVLIEGKASSPEYDVGIMGWGLEEEETITDEHGNTLDWELTQDELYAISGEVNKLAAGGYFDPDPEWDY